jgi:hypothetical protein
MVGRTMVDRYGPMPSVPEHVSSGHSDAARMLISGASDAEARVLGLPSDSVPFEHDATTKTASIIVPILDPIDPCRPIRVALLD